jgi:hypothetical protein
MNTEIKSNSTENSLLRSLFSLEGCTFYSLLNRDNHAKTGKVLRMPVDKMCRILIAVGKATTKQNKIKRKQKGGGGGRHLKWVLYRNSGVVLLSKNSKSSLHRFSDNF